MVLKKDTRRGPPSIIIIKKKYKFLYSAKITSELIKSSRFRSQDLFAGHNRLYFFNNIRIRQKEESGK